MAVPADPPPRLPYRLEALIWDAQHHFNQQNRYGYNGKSWKRFTDPMLLCEMCDQWFPVAEVPLSSVCSAFVRRVPT